jgi:hypothetical protein
MTSSRRAAQFSRPRDLARTKCNVDARKILRQKQAQDDFEIGFFVNRLFDLRPLRRYRFRRYLTLPRIRLTPERWAELVKRDWAMAKAWLYGEMSA